ncbi:DNA-binding GntR family transcriptional regulator [Marmoricola sp. URHA0025 HA25]
MSATESATLAPGAEERPPAAAPDATATAHAYLRGEILSGRMAPGGIVNQVHVARALKISRGPLREALRLLENEGLVISEQNRRSRVSPLTATDAEELYCLRCVNEALAVLVSAPLMTPEDVEHMRSAFARMDDADAEGNPAAWEKAHLDFHSTSMSRSSGRIRRLAEELREHAARYVHLYYGVATDRGPTRREHEEILAACEAGDGERAAEVVTRHLGHIGLGVLTYIDPRYEPIALRRTLRNALPE